MPRIVTVPLSLEQREQLILLTKHAAIGVKDNVPKPFSGFPKVKLLPKLLGYKSVSQKP